ncbi:hypothetical protein D3C75_1119860 [compost metagenome]
MLADLLHRLIDQAEHLLDPWQPLQPFGGQAQPARLTVKQGVTQVFFQAGDLPAHRALGDVQLLGCPGEVAALGRDQKRVQGGKGRKSFHGTPRHEVRTWRV